MSTRDRASTIRQYVLVFLFRREVIIDLLYKKEIRKKMLEHSKILAFLLFFSSLTVVISTCSSACVSCSNDICVMCEVGNYLQSVTCHTCPERCTSCNNSEVCYNCTEGYYGLSCDKNCISSMCLNNTCDKHSGICLHGCIEGYFLSGSSCYLCGANCKTCANFSNTCLECLEGYYGSSCQHYCSHCKDGICTRDNCTYGCGDGFFRASEVCHSCIEHCTNCSHYNNCQSCVNGYFGPTCQFKCSDCSPCNQNGSCPLTTTDPASTTTTQPTSSMKELVTTSFPTAIISTTSRPSTSTTQRTGTSKQSVSTFFPITTTSTTMTKTSQDFTSISGVFPTSSSTPLTNMESNSKDNTPIIYATAGGGGGLVVIILAIVVVCKRGRRAKQSDTVAESIDMTENENYISADDINDLTRNSSNVRKEVKQNELENNDALYSQPNKIHRPTMVSVQTISTETTEGGPSNISPTIPAKNNVYSDLI